jgi:hypothetical protein
MLMNPLAHRHDAPPVALFGVQQVRSNTRRRIMDIANCEESAPEYVLKEVIHSVEFCDSIRKGLSR